MGWLYDNKILKTKQDYINQLNEIKAYRSLDGLDFDFGTGLIVNDSSYGSEDAYYEMDIQNLEDTTEHWDEYIGKSKYSKKKFRLHKYHKLEIDKRKLITLSKVSWVYTRNCNTHLKRCYIGRRTSYLKKYSNRIVRKSAYDMSVKGNVYRRLFDYWWAIF